MTLPEAPRHAPPLLPAAVPLGQRGRGGIGLFFMGMWLLTENLKTLTSHRLRRLVHRWTEKRWQGFALGTFADSISQSMSALIFEKYLGAGSCGTL